MHGVIRRHDAEARRAGSTAHPYQGRAQGLVRGNERPIFPIMRKALPILAALLLLSAWTGTGSAQSLPSEGGKSGSVFGGGSGGSRPAPYRSPVSPPADNSAKRNESPSVDPRQGPGSSPSPGGSYGDTVQKQNDEAKRQREMIQRR